MSAITGGQRVRIQSVRLSQSSHTNSGGQAARHVAIDASPLRRPEGSATVPTRSAPSSSNESCDRRIEQTGHS